MTGTDERRILVADDEEGVRRLIVRVLEHQGYRVIEAVNGQAAWDCLIEEPVDLLITDLRMPDLDGQELLNRSRTLYPDMDVIVLTGYGTIQGAVYAMQRGALDYMTKPFGVAELEQRVSDCFRRRREREEADRRSPIEPLVELNRILSSQTDVSAIMDETIALVQRYFQPGDTELTVIEEGFSTPRLVMPAAGQGGLPRHTHLGLAQLEQLAQAQEPWLLAEMDGRLVGGTPRTGSMVTVPLVSGEEVLGALTLVERAAGGRYSRHDGQLLYLFGCQIALALQHTRTRRRLWDAFRDLEQATLSTVQTLFEALAIYDPYTHEHSQRVSQYARLLGVASGSPSGGRVALYCRPAATMWASLG
jgi:DNA-binding response OmpR family regulator